MMRRHLTGNEAAQAVGMLQAGKVQRAIAGHFNVSQSVISRLWNRFQYNGNVAETKVRSSEENDGAPRSL